MKKEIRLPYSEEIVGNFDVSPTFILNFLRRFEELLDLRTKR